MFYIRFTDNIERDIKTGTSKDFRTGKKLGGLCAWKVFDQPSPYASDEEIIEAATQTAKQIAKNSYGGYSSKNQFAVIEGDYIGSGNDGSLIKAIRVISVENL